MCAWSIYEKFQEFNLVTIYGAGNGSTESRIEGEYAPSSLLFRPYSSSVRTFNGNWLVSAGVIPKARTFIL